MWRGILKILQNFWGTKQGPRLAWPGWRVRVPSWCCRGTSSCLAACADDDVAWLWGRTVSATVRVTWRVSWRAYVCVWALWLKRAAGARRRRRVRPRMSVLALWLVECLLQCCCHFCGSKFRAFSKTPASLLLPSVYKIIQPQIKLFSNHRFFSESLALFS